MALKDIGKRAVEDAIEEFDRIHREGRPAKYGGGPSRRWYLKVGDRLYDQKLIIRAGHVHQGLGELAPQGKVRFNASEAREQLECLGNRDVEGLGGAGRDVGGLSRSTRALGRRERAHPVCGGAPPGHRAGASRASGARIHERRRRRGDSPRVAWSPLEHRIEVQTSGFERFRRSTSLSATR